MLGVYTIDIGWIHASFCLLGPCVWMTPAHERLLSTKLPWSKDLLFISGKVIKKPIWERKRNQGAWGQGTGQIKNILASVGKPVRQVSLRDVSNQPPTEGDSMAPPGPPKVIALIKQTKQVLYKNCPIRKAAKYVLD